MYLMAQTILPSGGLLLILMIGLLLFAGCTAFMARTPTTNTTSLPTTTFIDNTSPHIPVIQLTSIVNTPQNTQQQVRYDDVTASPPTCYFTPTQQATCLGWINNTSDNVVQFISIELQDSQGHNYQTTVLQPYIPAFDRAPYHLSIPLDTTFSLPQITITNIQYQHNSRVENINAIQIEDIRIERYPRTIGYDAINVYLTLPDESDNNAEQTTLIVTLTDEQERILSYRIIMINDEISIQTPYEIEFSLTPHINADHIQAKVTLLRD